VAKGKLVTKTISKNILLQNGRDLHFSKMVKDFGSVEAQVTHNICQYETDTRCH
jgi:hypothetical protein